MSHPETNPSSFHFETTAELTAEEYVRREAAIASGRTSRTRIMLFVLTVVGAVALLRLATLPVGILILAGALAGWTSPMWSRFAHRRMYNDATYAHGAVTVGASEQGLWYRGGALTVQSRWNGVKVWGFQDRFLWIGAAGMPTVYFPIDELRRQGLYEHVLQLAKRNGVEFDSAAARAGIHAPAT